MDYYQKYMKYKNKYLHAKHTLGYDMSGGAPKKIYIFFQDVADADNFMSVVAFIQLYGPPTKENPIHFVLTRRPENLGIPKFTGPNGPIKLQVLNTLGEEFDNAEDSMLIGEDGARRFITFMHKHYKIGVTMEEAYNLIKVYDGGCPGMSSNMNHTTHARDYLFDRGDLVSRNLGDLITPDEYAQLQIKYNKPELSGTQQVYDQSLEMVDHRQTRQKILREVITKATDVFKKDINKEATDKILLPLDTLLKWITEEHKKENTLDIVAFVLAPLTGLSNLFKTDTTSIFKDNLTFVYGQLFAWDNAVRLSTVTDGKLLPEPGTYTINPVASNIFKNQFNIDCDTSDVASVLDTLDTCPRLEKITWVPTEIVKNDIQQEVHNVMYYMRLHNLSPTPILQLWYQWSAIKFSPQIIFDPSVIFHAHAIETGKKSFVNEEPIIIYEPHAPTKYTPHYNRNVWQIKIKEESQRARAKTHTAVLKINIKLHNEQLLNLLYRVN